MDEILLIALILLVASIVILLGVPGCRHIFSMTFCSLFRNGGTKRSEGESAERKEAAARDQQQFCKDIHGIRDFVAANGALFSVIGLSGAVIGLIPGFAGALIGPNWKNDLVLTPFGIFALVLIQVMIISSAFLILYVSYLILCDLFACHWGDEVVHTILNRRITRENLEKGLFLIIFIPTVGTLVYFVVPIFSFVHDPFFINLNLVIILSFIWIYLCYWLFSRIAVLDWTRRAKNAAIAVLAILFVLGPSAATYFYVLPAMAPFSPESAPSSEWIEIRPVFPEFDPAHSHEHGLRLQVARTFLNTSGLDQQYWTFHWTASYGSFVVIDPQNHAVRQAGPDCYCPDSGCIVYWTWSPADQGTIKPPVSIYLSFENRLSKKIYAGTRLDLDWKAIDTVAVVER